MESKGHILWVDDEIKLLKPHILYLEKKGYKVTPVNTGEDAIYFCNEQHVDLILLDEMMTGLDGLTTLKKIKSKHSSLPVIMITKNEEEWLMEEAIAAQITNYLTKPVNPSQILIACKNVLDTLAKETCNHPNKIKKNRNRDRDRDRITLKPITDINLINNYKKLPPLNT